MESELPLARGCEYPSYVSMLTTIRSVVVAIFGVLAFVVAASNAIALILWLVSGIRWWPLLAPSCLYTASGLPAPPPQDYLINLAVFVPISWLAWKFARRKPKAA